jgi:hypothetical protein
MKGSMNPAVLSDPSSIDCVPVSVCIVGHCCCSLLIFSLSFLSAEYCYCIQFHIADLIANSYFKHQYIFVYHIFFSYCFHNWCCILINCVLIISVLPGRKFLYKMVNPVYFWYPNLVGYGRIIATALAFSCVFSDPHRAAFFYLLGQGLDAVDGKALQPKYTCTTGYISIIMVLTC